MFALRKSTPKIESGTYKITRQVESAPSLNLCKLGVDLLSFDNTGYIIRESVIIRAIDRKHASVTYLDWFTGKINVTILLNKEILSILESFDHVEYES